MPKRRLEDLFDHFHNRRIQKLVSIFMYLRKKVPEDALAVVLWDPKYSRWIVVSPGMKYDPSAWRASLWDEHGPISHQVDDYTWNPYRTKYHALADMMILYPRARVSQYFLPGQAWVEFAFGPPFPF
jgi:hypothetical protein